MLRQLLYRHVPPALIERPKMGFGVPARQLAARPAARLGRGAARRAPAARGRLFPPAADPRRLWTSIFGAHEQQYRLWVILMFQSWLEAQKGAAVSDPPKKALAG